MGGDDLLPVPLIHIDGVQGIGDLIPADGIHVGVQPGIHRKPYVPERLPLPLGQTVYHLRPVLDLWHAGDIEADRTLHTAEIVIEPGGGIHEQRCGGTNQMQTAESSC